MTKTEEKTYFNDWPNDIGFETREEQTKPVELKISGTIPSYVSGVLYRAATAGYTVQPDDPTKPIVKLSHWFDGFAQIHRFEVKQNPPRVIYNSRLTSDDLVNKIRETGNLSNFSFGQKKDPCASVFAKVRSAYTSTNPDPNKPAHLSDNNVNVTVSTDMPGVGSNNDLVIRTDFNLMQKLDPQTLEPIGYALQTVLHPELTGPLSAAHGRTDPETGDFFNFNLDVTPPVPTWRIFKVSKSTGKTEILARIRDKEDAPGAYIHSFFMTNKYVVLCVWNSKLAWDGAKMLYEHNVLDGIEEWDPHGKCVFFVVDRHEGKGLVKKFQAEKPFYAFHSINSWDEEDGSIVCEMPVYETSDVLKKFYYENMVSSSKGDGTDWFKKGRSSIGRWRLADVEDGQVKGVAKCEWLVGDQWSVELPTLNPNFSGKESRFIYAITGIGESNFMDGILKYDTKTGDHKLWKCHAHTPGEAIFVPDPARTEEDAGVLLSVVLDGYRAKSYLLVLDAATLEELARADMDSVVGLGFHGKFVNPMKLGGGLEV